MQLILYALGGRIGCAASHSQIDEPDLPFRQRHWPKEIAKLLEDIRFYGWGVSSVQRHEGAGGSGTSGRGYLRRFRPSCRAFLPSAAHACI